MLIVSKVLLNGYDVIIMIKSVKIVKIQIFRQKRDFPEKGQIYFSFFGFICDVNLS